MITCDVCGGKNFHEDCVDEVFRVDGRMVMVEHVPARVCDRCGDASFDRDTVERVRRAIHEGSKPVRHVDMEVFALA